MDSLVGDYLASVNPQLAKKFKKKSKASPLPAGSPNLAKLVKEFQKTSPAKRKLSLSNGHTPAKKVTPQTYHTHGLRGGGGSGNGFPGWRSKYTRFSMSATLLSVQIRIGR